MPLLKNVFDNLKEKILGITTSKIDSELDAATRDIIYFKSNSKINGYIDVLQALIAKTNPADSATIFHGPPTPTAYQQGERINRYKLYESIVATISYCARALNVIVDNILSPDDITKQSLEIRQSGARDKIEANYVSLVKEVVEKTKLEKNTDLIVKNTLLYGDFFIEIADLSQSLINRSFLLEKTLLNSRDTEGKEEINFVFNDQHKKIVLDFSSLLEETQQKENILPLSNIKLLFYEPARVVRLQSELFPICFGYLVFPKINDILAVSSPDNNLINSICRDILTKVRNKLGEFDFEKNHELVGVVNQMIQSSTTSNQILKVRFVPNDRMQHFRVPSVKFHPYGESILYPVQFLAKVLIALETALAISRLSRSTEKRKIAIEVGLSRDIRQAVEGLKEQFRKRKISLNSFGSVDTIPSQITTFEDIYIPQKDGKPFVEISTFTEGNVEVRGKVDEIKEIRDQIVAGMNVPPSFVGLEENLSNKCLDLLTPIKLINGKTTLEELIKEFHTNGEIQNKYTISYDHETGEFVPGKIVWAGITRKDAKVLRIVLDNDEIEFATPDHHFMLRNGEYREAQNLKPGDFLMSLNYPVRVVSIEWVNYPMNTGDITVEKYHNFSLCSGIIVSNSALSEENILFARTVITHQKYLGAQITELVEKIINLMNPEKTLEIMDSVEIGFPAPKSLQFEREASYLSNLSNVIENLERIGIPKEYAKQRYMTGIDWQEVEKYQIAASIDKTLDIKEEEPYSM